MRERVDAIYESVLDEMHSEIDAITCDGCGTRADSYDPNAVEALNYGWHKLEMRKNGYILRRWGNFKLCENCKIPLKVRMNFILNIEYAVSQYIGRKHEPSGA